MKRTYKVKIPHQYAVTITRLKGGKFSVRYGKQVSSQMEYAEAAREFGECVFHALGCSGFFYLGEHWFDSQNPGQPKKGAT